MSIRTLPVAELKRFIDFYEQTLIELMGYFERKEISFKALACYRNYTKYRFLFNVIPVGYKYRMQLDDIESEIMGKTSHAKLQYWFEDFRYFFTEGKVSGTAQIEYVIVDKNYSDEMEKNCDSYTNRKEKYNV